MTRPPRHINQQPNPWAKWRVSPGSDARDRVPEALLHPAVKVRPQSLAEAFAAAGRKLGATTPPHARTAPRASPWSRLFQQEPAYLLAELLSFNAADAGFSFSEALDSDPAKACAQLSALARQLDHWLTRIEKDAPELFSKQLEQMDVELLRAGVEASLTKRVRSIADQPVEKVLALAKDQAKSELQKKRPQQARHDAFAIAIATREALRRNHSILRNAVTALKPQAQIAFDARIRSGRIDPALGLLIAELRTAAHVDSAMNAFVDRHRTHFYQDILGQNPAPASPERVLLGLGATTQARVIPHGATLEALQPDGSVQQFETEAPVPLSPALIGDLRVLSYQTDSKISFNRILGGITRVRAAKIKTGPQNDLKPLFSSGSAQPAAMGLDITSPMLSLAEGTRRVDVSLQMVRGSNLPARSRPLDEEELKARDALWKAAGAASKDVPKLRKILAQDIEHTQPEVRFALTSDPDLTSAFLASSGPAAIDQFAHEVTEEADNLGITPSLSFIYEVLAGRVTTVDQLRLLLGRILILSMVEGVPLPTGQSSSRTWERIAPLITRFKLDADTATSMVFAAFAKPAKSGAPRHQVDDIFQALLGDALDVCLETPDGPRRPDMMQILPQQDPEATGGITIRFRLDPSAPPVVGADDPGAPCLSLRAAAAPRVCPVSFFERYSVAAIAIKTQVTGLRKIAAFSDDAPLVTDQTFQPFGPRPADGAMFHVGCAEMGRKPVTKVGVTLGWSDMPDLDGGFAAYYAAYGKHTALPKPEVQLDYLSGDGWKPVLTAHEPLFDTDRITGAILPENCFEGRVTGHAQPAVGRIAPSEYKSRQSIRAGLLRLKLQGTADGFNAAHYPQALVRAMRPRLLPFGARPLPKAPFVPTAAQVSLSYTAFSRMVLNAPESARSGESVTQINPFGATQVFPERGLGNVRLFPKRLGYGQLCVQITGPRATGPLALAFDTSKGGHLRTVPKPNPLRWYYLAKGGWQALPDTALSADTTNGLIRAGLVLVDLPEDADPDPSEMPGGGVWLSAVATKPDLGTFPSLQEIAINGVWARRTNEVARNADATRTWAFSPAHPGVTQVREMASPAALRPPEQPQAFLARVSERLRHRKRAVVPWDLERLLLQEFPEVRMAKCLPHLSRNDPLPTPRAMTVVALRTPPVGADLHAPCLFDVASLAQMQSALAELASEFADLEVVNPSFERLQVRAKIELDRNLVEGAMAKKLKTEIAHYLSVWTAPPALHRFGWRLNAQLLRAHLADLPFVKGITEFSVLHLAGNDSDRFELLDTAQDTRDRRGLYGPVVRPRAPWSLPLSARDHMLNLVYDLTDETPIAAGVGGLSVGDMLIVGQRTQS